MPSDRDTVLCAVCLGRIRWAITAHGRRQAVDAAPDPKGNLGAYTDGTGTLKVRVLSGDRARLEGAEWQAMPHAASCTGARRRPSSRPPRRPVVRPGAWRLGR